MVILCAVNFGGRPLFILAQGRSSCWRLYNAYWLRARISIFCRRAINIIIILRYRYFSYSLQIIVFSESVKFKDMNWERKINDNTYKTYLLIQDFAIGRYAGKIVNIIYKEKISTIQIIFYEDTSIFIFNCTTLFDSALIWCFYLFIVAW